ncbi:MAG: DNA-3-methyladenine glycosylase I [Ignavibacteria bacterium]|nr:DNA-3-methyladenine glycosylase I [Ignavibacteria bacterium]
MTRCEWCLKDDIYTKYHDEEWGVPQHDDRLLFEFLILETMQAGLSWHTILKRRDSFRSAYKMFDAEKVARFNDRDVQRLMNDAGIIRNRLKIAASIRNARGFLTAQEEFGSFDAYIWRFTDGAPIINKWKKISEIPATSKQSDILSKDLKQRGFGFVGSTIVYAHMQATGMVNDHLMSCFRYTECARL